MNPQKEREIFIAEVRQLDSFNFYEFSVSPFEFDEESRIFYFPPTQLLWETTHAYELCLIFQDLKFLFYWLLAA